MGNCSGRKRIVIYRREKEILFLISIPITKKNFFAGILQVLKRENYIIKSL
ncbi:hypothetical protein LEP1GSC074_1374 [Leptospira noguchii str. Hook]|nr:hypothetical protein LEP1GSC074_1374 [Leptospira noguchii str. Hook]